MGRAVGDPVPVRVPAPRRGLGALLGPDGPARCTGSPRWSTPGIRKFYNGPESFTPDNQFLLGEAPGLAGYFVGAGFNSVGIASAGGAGRALAEWVVYGEPPADLIAVDVRRFAPYAGDEHVAARAGSPRSSACTTPCRGRTASRETGRDVRLLAAARAARPPPGPASAPRWGGSGRTVFAAAPAADLDYGWGRPAWLDRSVAEQAPAGRRWRSSTRPRSASTLVAGPDALAAPAVGLRRRRRRAGRALRLHAVCSTPAAATRPT